MSVKILLSICLFLGYNNPPSHDKSPLPQENTQYIYVLRYTEKFKKTVMWTSKELQIARDHVAYIKALVDDNKGYVLGRTPNIYDPELFGIVIFDADNIEKAREIMQSDPIVYNNIMEGTLSPFSIVFIKDKSRN